MNNIPMIVAYLMPRHVWSNIAGRELNRSEWSAIKWMHRLLPISTIPDVRIPRPSEQPENLQEDAE